ncbi:MAG: ribonuclease R, partial [Thermoflexaceae bacterium]|nr:ribonuclease R [Thermoflexaceae bacterium]
MEKELLEERKKMICELINDELYVPMKIKELAVFLQVPKEARHELLEVLDALLDEGRIMVTAKGKYCKPDQPVKIGTFISNQRGFGFVETEDDEDDIFIPESEVNGAFHLDKVQVKCSVTAKNGKRREGSVVKILEHGITDVVGTFQQGKSYGFVIPDNGKIAEDIFIPKEKCKGALTGHKVVAHINKYPEKGKNPEGEITEIIGHVNDPGTDILSVVKSYDIPMEFPAEVMEYLKYIPEEINEKDKGGRMDLRDWQTVTIDGEDAKDLDDAITISKKGSHYTLGVHIADVSHYVTEGSPLDKEALNRGTSVYLVDRVIPMLPHKLSNGICSLNQGVDRLALSCIMEIDEKGNVVDHKIAETLINVDRRMTYTNVKKILVDKDEAVIAEYKELVEMFCLMEELALLLREKRRKRGSIDFDFPESKITLDKNGHAIDVKPYERNTATRIIEDFMLIANETVAEDFFWQEMPFVYRTHDNPEPEKITKLGMLVNNFGYSIHIANDDVHPKELQKLLDKIADTPEEAMISRLTLRSMKRAQYTTECTGHFGLA